MARTTIPAELVAINAIQGTLIADNSVTAVHIATNAISGTLVADNAITSTHIAQNNVTATQIAQNTITVTHMADSAIETAKINADAVTGAKIADNAIDSEHYTDGSIDTAHIADLQVTAAKIGANAVTLAKMASLARGSILIGNSSADVTALAIGSNGTVLKSDGTDVSWGTAGVAGISSSADATAITIDSSEKVGIGTATLNKFFNLADPTQGGETLKLHFEASSSGDSWAIYPYDRTNSHYPKLHLGANENLKILNTGAIDMIDSALYVHQDGDIGIGTTSPSHDVHIKRDASETALAIQSNVGGSGSAVGGRLRLQLGAQNNSGSGQADTQSGDVLGQILFEGQGTDYSYQGGSIKTIVTTGDGNDNRSNQATAMTFDTLAVGSVSPAERMRITADGYLWLRNTTANYDGGQSQMTSASTCQTMYVTNTGFADPQVVMGVERGASSAYKFFNMYSGRRPDTGGGDVEFQLRGDGEAYADGSWSGGGADYAEYFEWSDGNASSEDRIGLSVVLVNNKIREATSSDAAGTIIGVISGNPAVVGDTAYTRWADKYEKDDYGRYIMETYTAADGRTKDDKDNTLMRRKLNASYNESLTYVERENRKEWDTVGLMGKLRIKKGQQTGTNWIKMRDISASVEEWLVR